MKPTNTFTKNCLVSLLGLVIIVFLPIDAHATEMNGNVHVCAYPFQCIYRTKNTPMGGEYGPYLRDSESLVGPGNNWSEVQYLGDLAKGYAAAWARATRGYDPFREVWCQASASTYISWRTMIRFVIEPGTYPDGLESEAVALVKGRLSKDGAGTQVKGSYHVRFGDAEYSPGCIEQSISIDKKVVLTTTLINSGTVLDNHHIVDVEVSAGVGSACPLVASTWAGGTGAAGAMSDFAFQKYVRFISISEQPGVIWLSTDQFLTMPFDACRGDFNKDGDVDGADLSGLADETDRIDLGLFANQYGRSDCEPY
jgi:hypothetical protein